MFGIRRLKKDVEDLRLQLRYLTQYVEYLEEQIDETPVHDKYDYSNMFGGTNHLHNRMKPPDLFDYDEEDDEIIEEIRYQIDEYAKHGKPFVIRLVFEDL